jgi:4-hydroxybenzoate polyprenyltransferase
MDNRWWIYQKERFPVAAHGPLVAVFSYSALSYSALLSHFPHAPGIAPAVVAFLTALCIFLQLRIADEFKDFEDDSRYRPYRPVPRGLIKLSELAVVFVIASAIQIALAIWLHPALISVLLVVWIYLGLMSKEFFVRRWLKIHPVVYLFSHMFIMPLVDFYVTACIWMPAVGVPPSGLIWFLIISFFNGIVLEFGRKIRAPEDEELGVETYSAMWGRKTASLCWLSAMVATAFCAWQAASLIRFAVPVAGVTSALIAIAAFVVHTFLLSPTTRNAKIIEGFSGIWTLLMYLSLGIAPRFFH